MDASPQDRIRCSSVTSEGQPPRRVSDTGAVRPTRGPLIEELRPAVEAFEDAIRSFRRHVEAQTPESHAALELFVRQLGTLLLAPQSRLEGLSMLDALVDVRRRLAALEGGRT